ncbi:hypothetical protein F3B51_18245, partial [Bacteroides ovatus]
NNKAPACESRGFVRKKQKVCILTHLRSYLLYNVSYIKNPSRIPAATAEPITPATFGPIACISK